MNGQIQCSSLSSEPSFKIKTKTEQFHLKLIPLTVTDETNCTINEILTVIQTLTRFQDQKKQVYKTHLIFQGAIGRPFVNHVSCFCMHASGQSVFQNDHLQHQNYAHIYLKTIFTCFVYSLES